MTGISSYNVVPFDAGQYFNKIQCFCFEEQILNPNEQVRISDTVTSFFPAWNRVLYTSSVYCSIFPLYIIVYLLPLYKSYFRKCFISLYICISSCIMHGTCAQVDMPVFFYIDPEFSDDPAMARVTTITLSYTFFEAKEGESIYIPVPQKHKL